MFAVFTAIYNYHCSSIENQTEVQRKLWKQFQILKGRRQRQLKQNLQQSGKELPNLPLPGKAKKGNLRPSHLFVLLFCLCCLAVYNVVLVCLCAFCAIFHANCKKFVVSKQHNTKRAFGALLMPKAWHTRRKQRSGAQGTPYAKVCCVNDFLFALVH